MKKELLFPLIFIVGLNPLLKSQQLELTFTAIDNEVYVQVDSIKVMNRSQGGDTLLYWPDTVLSLNNLGVSEMDKKGDVFKVFQNYPNPVVDQTTISVYLPEKGKVSLIITDMLGRLVHKSDRVLDKGTHSFRFAPEGGNFYFFTAQWRGSSSSIKILQATTTNSTKASSLEYMGSEASSPQLKATEDIQSFPFNLGDELLYIGYTNNLQSGMLDTPEISENCTFQFVTNIPCPGTPTVTYEGQVYNTIQIFSQCWLKENLNVGMMIPETQEMTDNGIIEKYCYDNEPDSCTIYGGLYQWNEVMQYVTQQSAQGICPSGWHLPTDDEWNILEGAVDTQYGIGDQIWGGAEGYRGYDVGYNLKTTNGWYNGSSGTDLFGFSGLPGGRINSSGNFISIGENGNFWSSTECESWLTWGRHLISTAPGISRYCYGKIISFNVRCVRD